MTLRIFGNGQCYGQPLEVAPADELATGVAVSVADDTVTYLTATAVDEDGRQSVCSNALTYVEDSVAPPAAAIEAKPAPFTRRAIRVSWHDVLDSNPPLAYAVTGRAASWTGGFGDPFDVARAPQAGSARVHARPGWTYCFRVRVTDAAANAGRESAAACTARPIDDVALKGRGWARRDGVRGFYRGTFIRTRIHGTTATLDGVRTRTLALLATTGPGNGVVDVFLGGERIRRLDLSASPFERSRLIPLANFSSPHRGGVVVKVVSYGRPVTIDGLGTSIR